MIFQIPQTGEHVWVSAFDKRPESVERPFKVAMERCPAVSVQLVDLDRVPGHRYLVLAIANAVKSFHSKQPITRTLGMELLLYVAGLRQINEALRRIGVTAATRRVVAIAVGDSADQVLVAAKTLTESLDQEADDELMDDWSPARIKSVRSGFEVGVQELKAVRKKGETETATLERLAVERSAMLAVK